MTNTDPQIESEGFEVLPLYWGHNMVIYIATQGNATLEKSIDEGKRWAASVYDESLRTTFVFLAGMAFLCDQCR